MKLRRLYGPTIMAAALAAGLLWAATGLSGGQSRGPHPGAAGVRATVPNLTRLTPSETLVTAMSSLGRGQSAEIPDLFVSPVDGKAFVRLWQGRVPTGDVRVSTADQVDGGAEAGHRVPVEIWVSGPQNVAGQSGVARFVATPAGPRIGELRLAPITLKVAQWSTAAAQLPSRAQVPRPAGAPFYGRFRFEAGEKRFAVDARTGAVEEE